MFKSEVIILAGERLPSTGYHVSLPRCPISAKT